MATQGSEVFMATRWRDWAELILLGLTCPQARPHRAGMEARPGAIGADRDWEGIP